MPQPDELPGVSGHAVSICTLHVCREAGQAGVASTVRLLEVRRQGAFVLHFDVRLVDEERGGDLLGHQNQFLVWATGSLAGGRSVQCL